MQRGAALRRGVRIGAAIEQPGGQLVVRVGGGEQERVEADLVAAAAAAGWPAACGPRRRTGSESFMSAPAFSSASTAAMRPSRAANSSAVNPPFDRACRSAPRATSMIDHRGMAFGGRPHQRRLPAPAFLGVRDRRRAPAAASPHRSCRCARRPSAPSRLRRRGRWRRRRPRAASRSSRVAVDRGQPERRRAVAIGGLHVGAGANEQLHDVGRVAIDGPVQRRRAVRLRGVHIDALVDAAPEPARSVASLDGVDERDSAREPCRPRRARAPAPMRERRLSTPRVDAQSSCIASTRSAARDRTRGPCCRRSCPDARRPCRAASGGGSPAASGSRI